MTYTQIGFQDTSQRHSRNKRIPSFDMSKLSFQERILDHGEKSDRLYSPNKGKLLTLDVVLKKNTGNVPNLSKLTGRKE